MNGWELLICQARIVKKEFPIRAWATWLVIICDVLSALLLIQLGQFTHPVAWPIWYVLETSFPIVPCYRDCSAIIVFLSFHFLVGITIMKFRKHGTYNLDGFDSWRVYRPKIGTPESWQKLVQKNLDFANRWISQTIPKKTCARVKSVLVRNQQNRRGTSFVAQRLQKIFHICKKIESWSHLSAK